MVAGKEFYKRIISNTTLKVIRLQVAVIYLHAAIAKCYVAEWQNGTALYYWFTDPMFGISDWLKPIILPVITNSFTVSVLTWSIVILELMLFAAIISNKKYRPLLLTMGITFHIGIGLIHGLVSFMLAMTAALILFLRPADNIFKMPNFSGIMIAARKKKLQISQVIVSLLNYPRNKYPVFNPRQITKLRLTDIVIGRKSSKKLH